MTRSGAGNMLGVGGARRNLGREALRGGPNGSRVGGSDAQAHKRELLRRFQEKQAGRQEGAEAQEGQDGQEKREGEGRG
ncbi:DUF6243 family protein [Streptomyces cadmiisoli]|uniref:DUF6243 family protein n=1 Tax=Streptomyces cadmiisoli TaxID=2184053 RepID=UPI00365B9ACE